MNTGQRNESAVVFVCDAAHVRFALFMIWQISHHNPERTFDFVIYSPDEITLPDWASAWNIQIHRAKPLTDLPDFARFGGSAIPMYRFGMVRTLAERYRRILYMDTDMSVEGGDFNRLLAMDLAGMPVGGVLNTRFLTRSGHWPTEYHMVGLPSLPYLNAGLQLIDTPAYMEQEVEQRALAVVTKHPKAIVLSDQSALNLALKGRFAQLAPCWNWQASALLPLVTLRYPVFVRHFIATQKPDQNSTGRVEARFNLSYREFFARHDPDFLSRLAAPCDPAPMSLGDAARLVWQHWLSHRQTSRLIARHPDPYRAHFPQLKP